MLKWSETKQEHDLGVAIAKRAVAMAQDLAIEYDQMTAIMDIDACHSNGNPLRLQELLDADRANFAHDVFGIRANIDRITGKLNNCFLPRYSS